MALLDAYATAAEYRAIVADKGTGTDATLDAELLGMTRTVEKSLEVAPGAFNSATGTRVFDSYGEPVLYLRDRAGLAEFLQTIDASALKIDNTGDGLFDDYTWDLTNAWVRGLPENAAAHSEPYRALELRPLSTAPLSMFPALLGSVQITGTWGWAAVPEMVKQLVIHRAHELRESQVAGAAGNMPGIDSLVPMGPRTFWMFKEAERLYGRRIPAIA